MRESGDELSKGILSAFHVLDSWHLSDEEVRSLLGFPFGDQLTEWRAGNFSSMPIDVITRIRFVGAIYQLLRKQAVDADIWLRQPNPQFGHQTPLARMTSGDISDLKGVHDYLRYHFRSRKPKPV